MKDSEYLQYLPTRFQQREIDSLKFQKISLTLIIILPILIILSSCQIITGYSNPEETPEKGVSLTDNNTPVKQPDSSSKITPTDELHRTGVTPSVDISNYQLVIDGLVETKLSLSYEELLKYPTITDVALLVCPGAFRDNAEWTGIPLTILLEEAGISSEATAVRFYGLDGYKSTLSLEVAQREGTFLAHTVNGQTLPIDHGYPLRLVVKGEYGQFWVKWIYRIEVTTGNMDPGPPFPL